MKKLLLLALTSALLITFIPLITYGAISDNRPQSNISTEGNDDTIRVFLANENTAVDINFRDYITGVVAAEMPAEFHEEALSALTCAAATLARLKMNSEGEESLKGAVISTDPKKHQAYITKEEMKKRWKGDFDTYYEKLTAAVDKAIDYSLTYDGKLITPAYHAISTGLTEDAENVWSNSAPYLVSVKSPGDTEAPGYETKITLSFDEFRERIEENGAKPGDDITKWLGKGEYTKAGTLKSITIGGKIFSGAKLREIFSLRSAAITLSMTKDGVTLLTKGYGHGVGLSQHGANALAKKGFSWQEILKHYYTGVKIELI